MTSTTGSANGAPATVSLATDIGEDTTTATFASVIDPNEPLEAVQAEGAVQDAAAEDVMASALTRVGQSAGSPVVADTDASTTSVDIPPTMEFVENAQDCINGTVIQLNLYGEGCMECGHLVPSADEKQTKCHFNNGNPFCPAGFHRIVFVGNRQHFLSRLKKAQAKGDANRILKLIGELENEDLDTKQWVLRESGLLGAKI